MDLDDEEYDKGYLEDHNWECVVSLDFVKGVQRWVLDLLVSLFMHLLSTNYTSVSDPLFVEKDWEVACRPPYHTTIHCIAILQLGNDDGIDAW